MEYLNGFVTSFLITLLILSDTVAAQNDVPQRITITVHPSGQNVELMYTLRQPVQANNEAAGWIIDHSVPHGLNTLLNNAVHGYGAHSTNNDLIIKNIAMNDSRNGSEYQCVIFTTSGFSNQVVEGGDIIILYVAGVPGKVPDVAVTNSSDGNVVNFTLTWGEPVNHLDPIIMYNVSCSGDSPCPQSYNTSNNHTRSHNFTGFTANSYYTFSVVAINSIGSGEPGVVMVGDITTTTIAPSVVTMTTTTTKSNENMLSNENTMISTSFMDKMSTAISSTNMISSSAITTFISSFIGMMTTTMNTSNVPTSDTMLNHTKNPSEDMSTTIVLITNTTPLLSVESTTTDIEVTAPNTVTVTTSGTSDSATPSASETSNPTISDEDDQSNPTLVIIIIIIVVMIICCCCCMGILFCCCCEKRERQYPDEKLCVDPRCSFASLVILGVMTCGISILVWYMCLKNQSDDKGQDKYHKITNVSIIVLGVYTCGTSALLWWLYKGFCNTREKYNCNLEDKSAIPLSTSEVKSSKVPSVTNQLAGHNEEVGQFAIPSQTGTIQAPHSKEPVPKNEEPVPNNDEPVTSVINEMYEDRVIPDGYAVVDTEDVIARRNAAAAAKQDPVQHQTTANGEKYALPNKPPSTKQQGVKYVELERLPTSGRIHTTANDVVTPYAELC